MANTTYKTTFKLRRDTTANWELHKDTIPAAGEPCFDTELNILKIGDGAKTYEELEPIGNKDSGSFTADGKSILLEDGVFKLLGFDDAEIGAQPRKNADGGIDWIVPIAEDIDELKSDVEDLKSDVGDLQSEVQTLNETVTPNIENTKILLEKVATLEEQMNGEAEDYVDAKIDAKINEFANQISEDGTVNTLKELITYVANHGGELETIVADITDLQARVGDDPVRDQISTAIKNSGHITMGEAEEVFATKDESANWVKEISVNGKQQNIIDGKVDIEFEETLKVKASDEVTIADDGTLEIGAINVDKVIGIDSYINNCVNSLIPVPKITSITLLATDWIGTTQPYSQVIEINAATENSKIDLQPTAAQIVELQDDDIMLMTENTDGVITVYALGNKPTVDYTMQVLITEVTSV